MLEYRTLQTLNIPGLFAVSLIEEGVKLAFPIAVYIGWRYRHEADGLLFGVAAGMGFAALETMGYGLVAFFRSNGDFNILQQVLILRGFLSPAGHAAWTGYVCAMLWRERERKGHVVINGTVILAFFVAVLLHTLWNIVNNLGGPAATQLTIVIIGNIAVAGVSLILVLRRFFEARKLAAQYDV